jgi:hypothetical protein
MHKYYRIILSLTLVSFVMSQQEPVCNDREYNKLKTLKEWNKNGSVKKG